MASAVALPGCGGSGAASSGDGASANALIEPLPTGNPRAKALEPVAGESADYANLPTEQASDQPTPAGASALLSKAARKRGNGPADDAAISAAEVLRNGNRAAADRGPQEVHDIIEAGNQIARTPGLGAAATASGSTRAMTARARSPMRWPTPGC